MTCREKFGWVWNFEGFYNDFWRIFRHLQQERIHWGVEPGKFLNTPLVTCQTETLDRLRLMKSTVDMLLRSVFKFSH